MKQRLLAGTVVPLLVGFGMVGFGDTLIGDGRAAQSVASNPCAAANPCAARNPCAAAACSPRNPCAAAGSPCAAETATGATSCNVPRLQLAALSNPCAVAAANPCNPCAAANPCAALNPCNPCVAANPCAAGACGACSPCKPRAVAAANPCNPCAAANPCNPCAAEPPLLTVAEADAAYDCIRADLIAAYGASGNSVAAAFRSWQRFSVSPYPAEAHGPRYLINYANPIAAPVYKNYEDLDEMPVGSVVAKEGFVVGHNGQVRVGPLFIMAKNDRGALPDSGGWNYTLIGPDGSARTDAALQKFCNGCHVRAADDDYMMFMPDEFRVVSKK